MPRTCVTHSVPSSCASTSSVEEVTASASPPTRRATTTRKRRIADSDEEEIEENHTEPPLEMIVDDEDDAVIVGVVAPASPSPSPPAAARTRLRSGAAAAAASQPSVASIFAAKPASSSAGAATAAASSSSGPARKRLRRAVASSEDEEEKGVAEEQQQQEEEEYERKESHADDESDADNQSARSSSPRTRYAFRSGSGRGSGKKLAPTEMSALQRLCAERGARATGDTTTSRRIRKRLIDDSDDGDGGEDGDGAAGASSAASSKYARVEELIHDDDESDEEAVKSANEKYFSRARSSYDPEKEARELRRIERAEEERRAEEEALKDQRRDEAFQRFKAREAAKRAQTTGKGSGTTKASSQRAARKKRENLDEYDDGDGFIVPDDEYEEESDAGSEGFTHQQFDESRFEQEEMQTTFQMRDATMAPDEAFSVWCRYLCGAILDAGYTGIVDRNLRLRSRYHAAEKIIEEQFVQRRTNWVRSQTWDRKDAVEILDRMDSLGYNHSIAITDDFRGCEVCTPKKGHAHQSTHSLSYFGVPYSPDALKHPFRDSSILLSSKYEQHSYNVGQLCHQRLKLYHAMKHFKLHVMLSLKVAMKKACKQIMQREKPKTKQECFKVMYHVFDHDQRAVKRQYDIWDSLNKAAMAYSTADSRKAAVDLHELELMQDFDREECLLDLFNWRPIGKGDRFDQSAYILAEEEKRNSTSTKVTGTTAKRKHNNTQNQEEDEYELDEDAEREAAEAERRVEEVEHKARHGILVDDTSEVGEEDLVVLSARNTATTSTRGGGWRRKSSLGSMPPSSAESIQDDSDEDHAATQSNAPASTPANTAAAAPAASSGWRSRKGATLPLSLAGSSSPPKVASASAQSSPSSSVPSHLPRVTDGDSLHDLYLALSQEEKVSFLSLVGNHAQPVEVRAFTRALVPDTREVVKEWVKEIDEQM